MQKAVLVPQMRQRVEGYFGRVELPLQRHLIERLDVRQHLLAFGRTGDMPVDQAAKDKRIIGTGRIAQGYAHSPSSRSSPEPRPAP